MEIEDCRVSRRRTKTTGFIIDYIEKSIYKLYKKTLKKSTQIKP